MPKQIQTISIQQFKHGLKFMVENYECNPQHFFFCGSFIGFDVISGFNQYLRTYWIHIVHPFSKFAKACNPFA